MNQKGALVSGTSLRHGYALVSVSQRNMPSLWDPQMRKHTSYTSPSPQAAPPCACYLSIRVILGPGSPNKADSAKHPLEAIEENVFTVALKSGTEKEVQ